MLGFVKRKISLRDSSGFSFYSPLCNDVLGFCVETIFVFGGLWVLFVFGGLRGKEVTGRECGVPWAGVEPGGRAGMSLAGDGECRCG